MDTDIEKWIKEKSAAIEKALAENDIATAMALATETIQDPRFDQITNEMIRAQIFLSRGTLYAIQNSLDEAIADFSKAIDLDPNNATPYNNRGSAYNNQNKLNEAIADFSKAIELDPKYAMPYHNRGAVYFKQKKLDQAIADLSKAIELDPKYAKAYHNRGTTYATQNNLDEAIADFSKAIELDPNNVMPYNNRGSAYDNQNKLNEAIADFSKAIDLDPKYAKAYHNRGTIYFNQKKLDQAIADFSKAIELDPFLTDAFTGRGLAYLAIKDFGEAIADLSKTIDLNTSIQKTPEPEIYQSRATAYRAQGDFLKAINDLEEAKKIAEENPKTDPEEQTRLIKELDKEIDELNKLYTESLRTNKKTEVADRYHELIVDSHRARLFWLSMVVWTLVVAALLKTEFLYSLMKANAGEPTPLIVTTGVWVFVLLCLLFYLRQSKNNKKETISFKPKTEQDTKQDTKNDCKAISFNCTIINIILVPITLLVFIFVLIFYGVTFSPPSSSQDNDLSHTLAQWLRYGPFLILWLVLAVTNYLRASRELKHYQRSRFVLTHLESYSKDIGDSNEKDTDVLREQKHAQLKFRQEQLNVALADPDQVNQKDDLNLKKLDELLEMLGKVKTLVKPPKES